MDIRKISNRQKKATCLYDCKNAFILPEYEVAGCKLMHSLLNGEWLVRMKEGQPLRFRVCQECPDFVWDGNNAFHDLNYKTDYYLGIKETERKGVVK